MTWLYTLTIHAPREPGATPRDMNAGLLRQWARVRSDFQRRAITLSGLRCVSPLPCAAPVWELLLCFESSADAQLAILAIHAKLREGYDYRITFVPGGQMLRYAARYLAKADCVRAELWARTWGMTRLSRIGAGLPEVVGGGA